jgi:hypothetical protein
MGRGDFGGGTSLSPAQQNNEFPIIKRREIVWSNYLELAEFFGSLSAFFCFFPLPPYILVSEVAIQAKNSSSGDRLLWPK